MNLGKMPSRARAGTTQESKDKYIAATLKAAGVNPTTKTRQAEDDETEDTPQGKTGEQEVEPPESQTHPNRSNRGWEVNYLLNYDVLYGSHQDDQFVENPLSSEDRKRRHYSRR